LGNQEPKNRRTKESENQASSIKDQVSTSTGDQQPTSDNQEQIGDLIYLPNADYPYPFPVEHPPHYWMTEQTGRLAEAVEAYVSGENLTPETLNLIRQYMRQYLERAVMTGDANRKLLIGKLVTLRTAREIERFADELAEIGVEPF
jgi:hypothetical protein